MTLANLTNHLYTKARPYNDQLLAECIKAHFNKVSFHIIEVVDGMNISFFCNGIETRVYDQFKEITPYDHSINIWGSKVQLFQKIIDIQKQLRVPIQLFFTYYGVGLNVDTTIEYTKEKTRNFYLKDIKNLSNDTYICRTDLETICATNELTLEVAHRRINLAELKNIKNLPVVSLLAGKNGVYSQKVYKYIAKPINTIIHNGARLIIDLDTVKKAFVHERKIEEDLIREKLSYENVLAVVRESPQGSTFSEYILAISGEVYNSLLSENKLVSYKFLKKITARKLSEYMRDLPF
jgi:hypothetical protein